MKSNEIKYKHLYIKQADLYAYKHRYRINWICFFSNWTFILNFRLFAQINSIFDIQDDGCFNCMELNDFKEIFTYFKILKLPHFRDKEYLHKLV